jgi:hypothetical protein
MNATSHDYDAQYAAMGMARIDCANAQPRAKAAGRIKTLGRVAEKLSEGKTTKWRNRFAGAKFRSTERARVSQYRLIAVTTKTGTTMSVAYDAQYEAMGMARIDCAGVQPRARVVGPGREDARWRQSQSWWRDFSLRKSLRLGTMRSALIGS